MDIFKSLSAGTIIAGVALAGGVPFHSEAQSAEIRIGSHVPPKARIAREGYTKLFKKIEKDSNGSLTVKTFWGGAITRSPRKQYESMINGLQDGSPILPSYTQKLFPDFTLLGLPFMFNDSEESSRAAWKFFETGMMRGLDKVKVIAVYTNDNGGLHLSKTVNSLDGVKGFKIRAAGPQEAKTAKFFGGSPVSMSITQVAESLNRGVIQGTLTGWSALKSFRITPLIKTSVDLPLGSRSFFLGISKKKYDGLPAAAKKAIDMNSGINTSAGFGRIWVEDSIKAKKTAADNPKRNVIKPEGAAYAALKGKFMSFHQEWIKKTKDGQKKYDTMMKILKEIRGG